MGPEQTAHDGQTPETSHGAFIYTLLSGRALETVEHLEPGDYQKKDGDKVLWISSTKGFLKRIL